MDVYFIKKEMISPELSPDIFGLDFRGRPVFKF